MKKNDYKKSAKSLLFVAMLAIFTLNLGENCEIMAQGEQKEDSNKLSWTLLSLESSAEKGNPEAQYTLGSLYYFGDKVEKDHKKAVDLLQKAANQGHKEARHALGLCYYLGHGVAKNEQKAIDLFKKAARQGEPNSRTFLRKIGKSW